MGEGRGGATGNLNLQKKGPLLLHPGLMLRLRLRGVRCRPPRCETECVRAANPTNGYRRWLRSTSRQCVELQHGGAKPQ